MRNVWSIGIVLALCSFGTSGQYIAETTLDTSGIWYGSGSWDVSECMICRAETKKWFEPIGDDMIFTGGSHWQPELEDIGRTCQLANDIDVCSDCQGKYRLEYRKLCIDWLQQKRQSRAADRAKNDTKAKWRKVQGLEQEIAELKQRLKTLQEQKGETR